MANCTLRPAVAADEPLLLRIFAAARAEAWAAAGLGAAQLDLLLHQQFVAQQRHYQVHFAAAESSIVQAWGSDAGRVVVDRGTQEITLVDIALLPEFCGHGLGSTLLRALQGEAAASRSRLVLHVERHSRARAWYQRLGFVQIGEQGPHQLMHWQVPAGQPAPRRPLPQAVGAAC